MLTLRRAGLSRNHRHMRVLEFLPFGLLIGALARLLAANRMPGPWAGSLVVGAVGAMLGGWLGRGLALYRGERPEGFAMSLLGALALVIAYHAFSLWRARAAPGS